MARRRIINPSIWQSEDFAALSLLARLVFIGLFSHADDEGRGRGKAMYLKSVIFPYDGDIGEKEVDGALNEIASFMSAVFYSCGGSEYYALINWKKWQRVDRPQPSIIPPFGEGCRMIRRPLSDPFGNEPGAIPE